MGKDMEVDLVYMELLDVFPQVDPRILKAVAIENRTNIDAAFYTVVSDVLPYIRENPRLNENISSQPAAGAEDGKHQVVQDVVLAYCEGEPAPNHDGLSVTPVADSCAQKFLDEVSKISNTDEVMSLSKGLAHHLNTIPEKISDDIASVHEDLVVNHGSDILCQGESYSSLMANEESVSLPVISSSSAVMLHEVKKSNGNLVSSDGEGSGENRNYDCVPEIDSHTGICGNEQISGMTSVHEDSAGKYGNSYQGESYPLFTADKESDPPLTVGSSSAILLHEKEDLVLGDGKGSEEVLDCEPDIESYVAIKVDDEPAELIGISESGLQQDETVTDWFDASIPANGLAFLPSQAEKIELLDSSIEEAKNNKKTVFSSMEVVMNIMREVEAKEKAAEKAKEMASKGGEEILFRAEELKKMCQKAKEANNMHAGEIYGERSILATEAKELQLRLANLTEEKNEALCILDEMHFSLEARLLAANEEIRKAEEEKLENENYAKMLLHEQEAIMNKIVQEAKFLELEAEENSKLREFLVDRGRMVDTLHGEIGVICRDVKSLKSKFDQRVPLGESFLPGETTCILASSSGSSTKSISSHGLSDLEAPSEPTSPSKSKSPTELEGDDWEFLA